MNLYHFRYRVMPNIGKDIIMDILNLAVAFMMVIVPSCMLTHLTLKGDATVIKIMAGLYGNTIAASLYRNMRLVAYNQSMLTNVVTAAAIAVGYATLLPTFSGVELILLFVSTSMLLYVCITKKGLETIGIILIINSLGWFGPVLRALA